MADLTHLDDAGRARMVDVSGKADSVRTALAEGQVRMSLATLQAARAGTAKGEVTRIAEIAGIMGAKQTSALIPLCHPLAISSLTMEIAPDESLPGFIVRARAKITGPTGVEMEALTAVTVACLTLYDMLKALDKEMVIENIRLLQKTGGKSGDYVRAGS
jgi:cyclic pyranopterin phosphate synthase